MEADLTYWSRREAEEKAAAVAAPHPRAQQAHLEMAEQYKARVAEAAQQIRRHTFHERSAA
jgi:hypothetical protein